MAKKKSRGKRYSTKRNPEVQSTRLRKLRRILFTTLVVLVVAAVIFFLVLRSSGQISIFENAVGTLVTPVQNAFRSVTTSVKDFFTDRKSLSELQQAYDELSFENEQLRMELQEAEEAVQENENLKTLLDARDTYSSLDPIYAKVIARDAGPWFETFSVNRGSSSGVTTGMAVVNGDGLIGRVYEVGLNYSKVISIIDSRSSVACLMQRTRDNGIMRGQVSSDDDTAECFVYYLPNINNISPGDTVITSGTDSTYPKGLKIGTVTALSLDAGSEGTYAVVTPSVDFQRIEEVFILRTVIETDSDENLPDVRTLQTTEAYGATPTPGPNAEVTPTPEPTQAIDYWTRPTPIPDTTSVPENSRIASLFEDEWAAGD
ncbi:MAG: rod shape-determining protein MreC [Aristaeellaceae bacterium]